MKDNENAMQADVFHRAGHRKCTTLNGTWEFRRDPDDEGSALGWHRGEGEFRDVVRVPGAPQAQGLGEPDRRQRTFFMEPFWARRTFDAPALGPADRMWLKTGGILPAAEIYVNGQTVGYTRSSRTPQRVDVTSVVRASPILTYPSSFSRGRRSINLACGASFGLEV